MPIPMLAERVAPLVDAAEYKRRQSPPGVRITARAFGKDRRMPITNRFRDGESRCRPVAEAASSSSEGERHAAVSRERMSSDTERSLGVWTSVALTLVESARLCSGGTGGSSFGCSRLLGGWVANETEPEARLLFDVQSRHHAWHAQLWARTAS